MHVRLEHLAVNPVRLGAESVPIWQQVTACPCLRPLSCKRRKGVADCSPSALTGLRLGDASRSGEAAVAVRLDPGGAHGRVQQDARARLALCRQRVTSVGEKP